MRWARVACGVLSLAASSACLLTNDFFALEEGAPLTVIEAPDGFPGSGFGAALAAYEDEAGNGFLAVGGSLGNDVFVFRTATASGELAPDAEHKRMCGGFEECASADFRLAFAWVRSFGAGRDCLAMGARRDDLVFLSCVGNNSIVGPETVAGNGTFGTSVASVPGGDEVFVGAPAGGERVYRWSGARDVPGLGLTVDLGALGTALAAVDRGDGVTRLAIGEPGRVVVVDLEDPPIEMSIDGTGEFGTVLAWGDSIGDRDGPELHVGGDGRVRVFTLDDLAADGTAEDGAALECASDCETFGDALAVGDVTGDGRAEVVVGWPGRRTAGKESSGAVAVFANNRQTGPAILRDSSPERDDRLGRAVAVAPVGGRGEIVAGAEGEIVYFFCSGLAGDSPGPGVDDRCR